MSLCDQCIQGVTHEGIPTGQFTTINGVRVYVSVPTKEYKKDKAILFLPDGFGADLVNSQLLIDDFAKNGFQVYMPDYFLGDAVPVEAFENPELRTNFSFPDWIERHGPEQIRPIIDSLIAGLKEQGINEFAAVGYCFGARYVFDIAFDKQIKVAAVSHPSMLNVPEDLERFKLTAIPLLINSCEIDQAYPPEKQKIGDEVFGGGKMEAEGYKRTYFAGCSHGFAVRGDMSQPAIREGKEGAFSATVEWFIKYL